LEKTVKSIQEQLEEYARGFLKTEYGDQALKKLATLEILAVDTYDTGGVSEATEKYVKVAVKRDINAGKLTGTTKLIVRHELGHVLDENSPAFPEFDEEIEHERTAWIKAKPQNSAENWYKNLSIRTHIDPLKMQLLGFPRPETKISYKRLKQGTNAEMRRMKKSSPFVDRVLAERFAMANLIENPHCYSLRNA
jgi:hypothetical protein